MIEELARQQRPLDARKLDHRAVCGALMCLVLLSAALLRLFDLFNTPQGILFDEAYNAVDAVTAFANPTPFFHGNFGREAGFIYLQALSLKLFGYSTFAMRFPAACLGILTVAVSYPLFTRLFNRSVGLLSAAWLSWSLWHVIFSRTGLRAIALPLVLAIAFYCYARAVSSPHELSVQRPSLATKLGPWRYYLLAGIFLGLAQYTYTAARFAPFVVVLAFALRMWAHPQQRRVSIVGLGYLFLSAGIICLPLGLYFLGHPADFLERAQQVSVFTGGDGGTPGSLVDSLARTLELFGVAGDRAFDRNLPGMPALDPASYLLFLLGVGVALLRWRSVSTQLALCWLAVMLLPHALTSAFLPNYLRAIGVMPVMFAFPSLGLDVLIRAAGGKLQQYRSVLLALALVGMLAGTVNSLRIYFQIWAPSPSVHETFNIPTAKAWAAGFRLARLDKQERVYVSIPGANGGADPVTSFISRAAQNGHEAEGDIATQPRPFVGGDSFVIPPVGQKAAYVVVLPMSIPEPIVQRHLRDAVFTNITPDVSVITANSREVAIEHPFEAHWEDLVDVVGYALPSRVAAGDTMPLIIYWRIRRTAPASVAMFAHLVDASHSLVSQVDKDVSLLQERQPDEVVAQLFDIPVPKSTSTGAYWLSVGMYRYTTLHRLKVLDAKGMESGDSFLIGPVKVSNATNLANDLGPRANGAPSIAFDHQIALPRFGISSTTVRPGGKLTVDLDWQALVTPATDYKVFLQLLDGNNRLLAQVDTVPRAGGYPTSLWDPGESVHDVLNLSIPDSAPEGPVTLIVGFYDSAGRRLLVSDANGKSIGDYAPLGTVRLQR